MRTDVLGVAFDNVTMDEAVDRALAMLEEEGPHLVVTPNPEIVQRAAKDSEFAGILSPTGSGWSTLPRSWAGR